MKASTGFHKKLIWLKFNSKYFMRNYRYFIENNEECLNSRTK